jgi:DNA-binding beta-propeller fold protein YncE
VSPPIIVTTPTGRLLRSWGTGNITEAHGLAIQNTKGGKTTIWVTDQTNKVVKRFSQIGTTLAVLGTPGVASTGLSPLQFDWVADIAFSDDGSIYISDGDLGMNSRILKLDSSLNLVWAIGNRGAGPSQFYSPHSIAYDQKYDRVWVADRGNNRTQIFNKYGTWLGEWTQAQGCFQYSAWGIRIDNTRNQAYVVSGGSDDYVGDFMGSLMIMDLAETLTSFGPCHTQQIIDIGTADFPHELGYDSSNGDVYVATVGSSKVFKYILV